METKNYYEILGVPEDASQKDISIAFKKLAKKYHPDKYATASEEERKEAEEKFKEINEANEVLSNPEKRQQYDNGGMSDWEDFYSNYNPFGGRRNRVIKGTDIQINIEISIEDAYKGVEKKIKYSRYEVCEECHGTGSKDGNDSKCPYCNGSGMITETRQMGPGSFSMTQRPCHHCNGTGKIITNPCNKCHGNGLTQNKVIETINIPRGISDGMAFAIKGAGNAPSGGNGINGDLIVRITIKEDDYFKRPDEINIVHYEDIPFNECLLGFEKEFDAIDGTKVKVKAPELTPHGKPFIFKGKGMPHPQNPYIIGDYIVVINHKLPNKLTDEQKEKLRNF